MVDIRVQESLHDLAYIGMYEVDYQHGRRLERYGREEEVLPSKERTLGNDITVGPLLNVDTYR